MNSDPNFRDSLRDKKMPGDVKISTPFTRWVENFWYHHKWKTIVVLFFVILIGVGVYQMFARDEYDSFILYGGPVSLSHDEENSIRAAFVSVGEDYDQNGTTFFNFQALYLMTNAQFAKFKADNAADLDSMTLSMIGQTISNNKTMFNQEILAGEAVICLLDPNQYEIVKSAGGFQTLNDTLGYVPDGALDEYGIYLRDTEFGRYFTAFSVLPQDTILCIRRISTFSFLKNQKSAEKYHSYAESLFAAILTFEVKQLGE